MAEGYSFDVLRRASVTSGANSFAWFAEMVDGRHDDRLIDVSWVSAS